MNQPCGRIDRTCGKGGKERKGKKRGAQERMQRLTYAIYRIINALRKWLKMGDILSDERLVSKIIHFVDQLVSAPLLSPLLPPSSFPPSSITSIHPSLFPLRCLSPFPSFPFLSFSSLSYLFPQSALDPPQSQWAQLLRDALGARPSESPKPRHKPPKIKRNLTALSFFKKRVVNLNMLSKLLLPTPAGRPPSCLFHVFLMSVIS